MVDSTSSAAGLLNVEVVYGTSEKQSLVELQVSQGCTVLEAIELSGISGTFPEFELDLARLGIFGKKVSADRVLREGDRVEIYRPLIADPKEARRLRAAQQ